MVQNPLSKEQFWEGLTEEPVRLSSITIYNRVYKDLEVNIQYDGRLVHSLMMGANEQVTINNPPRCPTYISMYEFTEGVSVQYLCYNSEEPKLVMRDY